MRAAETENGVVHQYPAEKAGDQAIDQTPVDIGVEDFPKHIYCADVPGGGIVEARRVVPWAFAHVVQERDGDVVE